eukprot:GHVS01012382.1.p1 GENE.GHVS01012382.1~~GHVS01012382.1.p1  ORF type:complete len:1189 (+),score=295.26 GHVS01012382.1:247-3813(+)
MDSTTPEQTVPHQNRLTTSMSPTVTASLSNTSSPLTINRHSDTSLLLPSFATTSDTTTVAATGLSLLPTAAAVRTAADNNTKSSSTTAPLGQYQSLLDNHFGGGGGRSNASFGVSSDRVVGNSRWGSVLRRSWENSSRSSLKSLGVLSGDNSSGGGGNTSTDLVLSTTTTTQPAAATTAAEETHSPHRSDFVECLDCFHWECFSGCHNNNNNCLLGSRSNLAATCVAGKIFVFGGLCGSKDLDDLIFLHTESAGGNRCGSWEQVVPSPNSDGRTAQPVGRVSSSLVAYEDGLFLFGGHNALSGQIRYLNDLCTYSRSTNRWKVYMSPPPPPPPTEHTTTTSPSIPALSGTSEDRAQWPGCRSHHACTVDPVTGIMYVQGGRSVLAGECIARFYDDLWSVNLDGILGDTDEDHDDILVVPPYAMYVDHTTATMVNDDAADVIAADTNNIMTANTSDSLIPMSAEDMAREYEVKLLVNKSRTGTTATVVVPPLDLLHSVQQQTKLSDDNTVVGQTSKQPSTIRSSVGVKFPLNVGITTGGTICVDPGSGMPGSDGTSGGGDGTSGGAGILSDVVVGGVVTTNNSLDDFITSSSSGVLARVSHKNNSSVSSPPSSFSSMSADDDKLQQQPQHQSTTTKRRSSRPSFSGGYPQGMVTSLSSCVRWSQVEKRRYGRAVGSSSWPDSRAYHSAIAYNGAMYLFGGVGSAGRFHDIWRFDFTDQIWSLVLSKGRRPSMRQWSGVALLGDTVFVHGGTSGFKHYNDLYSFNMRTQEWCLVEHTGDIPSERCGHALIADMGQQRPLWTRYCSSSSNNMSDSRFGRAKSCDTIGGAIGRSTTSSSCMPTRWDIYSVGGSKDSEVFNKVYRLTVPLKLQLQAFPEMLLRQQTQQDKEKRNTEQQQQHDGTPTLKLEASSLTSMSILPTNGCNRLLARSGEDNVEGSRVSADIQPYVEVVHLLKDKLLQLENRLEAIREIEGDPIFAPILNSLMSAFDRKKEADELQMGSSSNRNSIISQRNNNNTPTSSSSRRQHWQHSHNTNNNNTSPSPVNRTSTTPSIFGSSPFGRRRTKDSIGSEDETAEVKTDNQMVSSTRSSFVQKGVDSIASLFRLRSSIRSASTAADFCTDDEKERLAVEGYNNNNKMEDVDDQWMMAGTNAVVVADNAVSSYSLSTVSDDDSVSPPVFLLDNCNESLVGV